MCCMMNRGIMCPDFIGESGSIKFVMIQSVAQIDVH